MPARLFRIVPLLLFFAVAAGVVYIVFAWLTSPARAKEILIKFFSVLTLALSIFFAIASLYAVGEQNWAAFDLFLAFLITSAVCLAIVRICRAVFLRNNPTYRNKRKS